MKNDKTIIQFSLKELIKENTEPHYKDVVSGDYFVMKIAENCDLKLRELADQAFFLHSVTPEDDSLLVLFGFPAEKLDPGSGVKMRLSICERKDWQSILKNHGTKK